MKIGKILITAVVALVFSVILGGEPVGVSLVGFTSLNQQMFGNRLMPARA